MASVSIVFRDDRVNKNDEAPINFFIIKDRKTTKVSIGIKVGQKFWDDKHKRVKSSHPNAKYLNSLISNKYAELQDVVLGNTIISKSLTSGQLKQDLFGKKPLDFFPFAEGVINRYKKAGQIGTHDRCQAIINKLKEFAKKPAITFQEITPQYLLLYEKHLRDKKKNSTNTIHANFKFIRQVFNEALNQDLIDSTFDSFKKFKVKTEKTQRVYLTEDELELIENYDCGDNEKMAMHRDMFVFAAYTGGLRVSDVLKLKWKNIDKSHIHITVKKTAGQLSIKVPDKSFALIEKYKPAKFNKEYYVFPMLPNGLDENDFVALDNEISKGTALINKNLKILEEDIELGKHISFHISRHTWATRALRKGISIDKVSKLMGHAQIKETQIYAKIVNEELDKAMDVFNN